MPGMSPVVDHQADPLVCLPGTLCDERLWAPVLEELGLRVQVIELTGAASTRDMARRVLDHAPARFALAGFSLGGIVALEVVAQAPERVSRLALVDTNPLPDPPESQARRHAAADRARAGGIASHVAADLLPHYFAGRRPELEALALDMAGAFDVDGYANQSRIAATRADSRPRLCAIDVPVLILCGADDRLCPPDLHRAGRRHPEGRARGSSRGRPFHSARSAPIRRESDAPLARQTMRPMMTDALAALAALDPVACALFRDPRDYVIDLLARVPDAQLENRDIAIHENSEIDTCTGVIAQIISHDDGTGREART